MKKKKYNTRYIQNYDTSDIFVEKFDFSEILDEKDRSVKKILLSSSPFSQIYRVEIQEKFYIMKVFKKIKILKYKNKHENECFLNEVRVLQRMDNINLLKILKWSGLKTSKNSSNVILCDYCPRNLSTELKKGNLKSVEENLKIAFKIAQALLYLKQKQIIHRNLKLNNVGFDMFGEVKIIGFYFSRILNEKNTMMKIFGSPCISNFIAPEISKNG